MKTFEGAMRGSILKMSKPAIMKLVEEALTREEVLLILVSQALIVSV